MVLRLLFYFLEFFLIMGIDEIAVNGKYVEYKHCVVWWMKRVEYFHDFLSKKKCSYHASRARGILHTICMWNYRVFFFMYVKYINIYSHYTGFIVTTTTEVMACISGARHIRKNMYAHKYKIYLYVR